MALAAFAHQEITVDSLRTLDAAQLALGASLVEITVEGGEVRFYCDGTSPTATLGHMMYQGSNVKLHETAVMQNWKMYPPSTSVPAANLVTATYLRDV